MINKKSYNLTGQERISVDNSKAYVIHDKKTRLFNSNSSNILFWKTFNAAIAPLDQPNSLLVSLGKYASQHTGYTSPIPIGGLDLEEDFKKL